MALNNDKKNGKESHETFSLHEEQSYIKSLANTKNSDEKSIVALIEIKTDKEQQKICKICRCEIGSYEDAILFIATQEHAHNRCALHDMRTHVEKHLENNPISMPSDVEFCINFSNATMPETESEK